MGGDCSSMSLRVRGDLSHVRCCCLLNSFRQLCKKETQIWWENRRVTAPHRPAAAVVGLADVEKLSRRGSATSDERRSKQRNTVTCLRLDTTHLLLRRQLPNEMITGALVAALEPRYACWRISSRLRSQGGADGGSVDGSCLPPGRSAGPKREMVVVVMAFRRG